MSFYIELARQIDRANEVLRDHVSDCPVFTGGDGNCAECDRLFEKVDRLRRERSEGPEWERDE